MREQVLGQLVRVLQEWAGLDAAKAEQVVQVVADFAQQHAGELLKMATGGGGGEQDMLGKILGRSLRFGHMHGKNGAGTAQAVPAPIACFLMMGRYCGS